MKKLATIFLSLNFAISEFTFETCYKCADQKEKKLCYVGGHVKNAWTGACCSIDDQSDECRSSDDNVCSDTFTNMNEMFYAFCPLNNHTMCTDSTSTVFEASPTPQNFRLTKMMRSEKDDGSPLQQDACTYEL